MSRHSRKMLVAALFVSFAGFAFASMGGEKKNRKNSSVKADFVPIRTSAGFTLKAGPAYKGSISFNQQKPNGQVSYNSLITYQKGNTTYIMPYTHSVNVNKPATCDNTQLLRLKLRINK